MMHIKNSPPLNSNSNSTSKSIPNTWDCFGHVKVIKNWSDELKAALSNNFNLEYWPLVGHAITFISDDEDNCSNIVKKIAEDTELKLLELSSPDVITSYSDEDKMPKIDSPTIVYLKPGSWMKEIDLDQPLDEDDASILIAQDNLSEAIRNFNPSCPVIFITSVSELSDLSVSFRSADLFNRRFTIIKLTLDEVGQKFINILGKEFCSDSFLGSAGKIGKLLNMEFKDARRQAIVALALKRIAIKEMRTVEFSDLVKIAMNGTGESDEYPSPTDDDLNRVAVHEAGHAAMAIIDSGGNNVPEYTSIIETKDFRGVVADSISYLYNKHNETTYEEFRHRIRVGLAGRVAEHLIFGYEKIGCFAAEVDLKSANKICYEMFASNGISGDMGNLKGASSNLTIISDEPTAAQVQRIDSMINKYLSEQYQIVYATLEKNRALLENISNKLVETKLMSQNELIALINNEQCTRKNALRNSIKKETKPGQHCFAAN